jgi:hypothetical protein
MDGAVRVLVGRELRYAVALALHRARVTVGLDELAEALAAEGYGTRGEPRKAISDAVRWELVRGRAVRIDRGRYRSSGLARSTVRWMRQQLDRDSHPVVSVLRNGEEDDAGDSLVA